MSDEVPEPICIEQALTKISEKTGAIIIETPQDSMGNPIPDQQVVYNVLNQKPDMSYFFRKSLLPGIEIILEGDQVTVRTADTHAPIEIV